MSDEATLFLLKEKLTEIKNIRIVYWIASIPIFVFISIALEIIGLDYAVAWISALVAGLILVNSLDVYYGKQKAKIMQQIEQMAFKKE